jgi:UDP-N-acetylglucosamine:LPS N-acetylglucosamine transferase
MKSFDKKATQLLAIASFGGHWVQMLRLKDMLERYSVTYVSCQETLPYEHLGKNTKYYQVPDVSKESHKIKLFISLLKSLYVLLKVRPKVVISTGALPGLIMIVLAKKLLGAKTIWLDSIANGDQMSISGKHAKKIADVWLTQWEDLSTKDGPEYLGRVI